jgi:lipopolysaccharide/colanic/teichoic acid biosynthesis glycosyltransferase
MSYESVFTQSARFPRFSDFIKRFFDVVLSGLGLILLTPLAGLIAVWIKRDSPGPVLYRGLRAAKGGGTFQILKFRTMYERPETYQGPKVTGQKDERITRVGRWLRETKLNELPQLWNVIKGQMSLVGPRPEDPDIVETWSEDVRREILSVRPGISSPASVLYRNEEALLGSAQVMRTYFDSILPSKLRLDQLYVRYRTFWLDLDVLFWTFLVLLPRLGSYEPPEDNLFWGPVSRLIQRHLSWFSVDALITFFAFGFSGVIWRSFGPLNVGWSKAIGVALGFSLLFSLTSAVMGANRIAWSKAVAADIFDLLPAAGVATVVVYGVNYILSIFPSGMILMVAVVAYSGYIVTRYRTRLITGLASRLLRLRPGPRAAGERVLIIGGGEAGQFAAWMLNSGQSTSAFQVVGFVDDDLFMQGVRIRGVSVVGKRADIPLLVRQQDIGIIVFAIHNITLQERVKLLEICEQTPAKVVMLPDFLGMINAVAAIDEKGRLSSGDLDNLSIFTGNSIPVAQVDSWLEDLEEAAQIDDPRMLLHQIHFLRNQCRIYDINGKSGTGEGNS